MAGQTRDERYYDFLLSVGKDLGWQTGSRRYFADDYCIAQVYANCTCTTAIRRCWCRCASWPVVNRAWGALAGSVHPDGKLGYVQPVGAAPDHVDADTTETYGPGAFLLAGSQLVKYLEAHPQMP